MGDDMQQELERLRAIVAYLPRDRDGNPIAVGMNARAEHPTGEVRRGGFYMLGEPEGPGGVVWGGWRYENGGECRMRTTDVVVEGAAVFVTDSFAD
jgi:hypothetical protein